MLISRYCAESITCVSGWIGENAWLYLNHLNLKCKCDPLYHTDTLTHTNFLSGWKWIMHLFLYTHKKEKHFQFDLYSQYRSETAHFQWYVPVKEAGLIEKMDRELDREHPDLEFWEDGGPSEGSTPPAGCCGGSWFFSFRHFSRDSRRRSSFWEDSCTRDWAWREDDMCCSVWSF